MMNFKKIIEYKDFSLIVPVILAIMLAIWAAYAYEAPEYDVVDSCKETFTITYTNDDGKILQTHNGRLAWYKEDNGDVLCIYDPEIKQAAIAGPGIVDKYKDNIEGREYGLYRYAFWWPLIIFIVVFGAILLLGWMYLSDYLLSRYVIAHPSRENCMDFLITKPVCGSKDVEEVFFKYALDLASQKRPQWQKQFKPEFYSVLDGLLRQMVSNKNVVVNYKLKFDSNTLPMSQMLKKLKESYQAQPDSQAKTQVLREIEIQEKYPYRPAEFKVTFDNAEYYVSEFLEKLFNIYLKEKIFGFHGSSCFMIGDKFPGQLYVDLSINQNLTPIILKTDLSSSQIYYPGFNINIKVYTYIKNTDEISKMINPDKYIIFSQSYRHDFKFNKQDADDFSAKDMYKDAFEQTFRNIIKNMK